MWYDLGEVILMKIVLCEPLGVAAEKIAALAAPLIAAGHEFAAYDAAAASQEELAARLEGADAAVIANSPFGETVAEGCSLGLLSVAFTGVDHVAVETLRAKGCVVSNCAGYATEATAELALLLMLAALRHSSRLERALKDGRTRAGFAGGELRGRRVGVVGTGAIGMRVIELVRAFGAEVVAFSRTERDEVKAMGVEYLPLDELLSTSDVVTLHVPATAATKNLISAEKLALMKPTAVLVNTARGALVDGAALADALNGGRLAAAGVDVFEAEPPIEAHPLYGCETAVLTPHIGFASREALEMRAEMAFENVRAWINGEPRNVM